MIGFIVWEYDINGLPEKGYIEVITLTDTEKIKNLYKIIGVDGTYLRNGTEAKFILTASGSYWQSGFTRFYTDELPEKTFVENNT